MFKRNLSFIKARDISRPVIFSYPRTTFDEKGIRCFDILSLHYPDYKGQMWKNLWQPSKSGFGNDTMVELYDEYAHVACYDKFTLRNNAGIREFWGESIDRFWNSMYESKGCAGGAIYAHRQMKFSSFLIPAPAMGPGELWMDGADRSRNSGMLKRLIHP